MGLAATKQEAFWEACGFGHKERVRAFIDSGIDVNWVSYTHNSCAIHVASQGKPEIVQMLLKAGSKVNVMDDRGNLAIHHAAMKGHAEIVQMLVKAHSFLDIPDKNGWTPLISAAYFCQPTAVQVLIASQCDVNLKNKDDRTALHEACRSPTKDEQGLKEVVQMLVQAGCDKNAWATDFRGSDFTPLMFCAYHGHVLAAQALISAGCDINAQGSNKFTALHWAVDRDQRDVVIALLEGTVNPHLRSESGELALDRTSDRELKQVITEWMSQNKNHPYTQAMLESPKKEVPENFSQVTRRRLHEFLQQEKEDLLEAEKKTSPVGQDSPPVVPCNSDGRTGTASEQKATLEQDSLSKPVVNLNKQGKQTAVIYEDDEDEFNEDELDEYRETLQDTGT